MIQPPGRHEAFQVPLGKRDLLGRAARRRGNQPARQLPARLYDLDADIAEKNDVAAANADVVKRLTALAEKARADLGDGPRKGAGQRVAGYVEDPKPFVK